MSLSLLKILDDILAQRRLTAVFQPILDLRTHTIHGYEALIRGPSDTPLHAPTNLFDTAARYGRSFDLELLCQEVAITQYIQLDLPGRLFLNVSPLMLLDPGHAETQWRSLSRFANLQAGRIVIDLTEQQIVEDYLIMREAIAGCRAMGYLVAMDDLGNGYAGLRAWSELRPDYIKIDRHFIDGVHEDTIKRQFVHSMHELAIGVGCAAIAEGIETAEEYGAIRALNIPFGQGHYFARPHAHPPREVDKRLFLIGAGNGNGHHGRVPRYTDTVGSIVRHSPTVEPADSVETVGELFRTHLELQTIPVVQEHRPVGIVERNSFMQMFASRFGRDLFGRKPIVLFMNSQPVIVEKDALVDQVSQSITTDTALKSGMDFIIADKGRYLGMGSVIDLLKRITELQLRAARYANPLTLLPGNVPISEKIDTLLAADKSFTVCYCDIDNFKPFNDTYGYGRGDDVIRCLAGVLTAHADPDLDFIGHVGGDDFIMIFLCADWMGRCERILSAYAEGRGQFYDDDDPEAGGIVATDRRGQPQFYPLLSLSIGAVQVFAERRLSSAHDVAILASEAKSQAKKQGGNALFFDRRGGAPAQAAPAPSGSSVPEGCEAVRSEDLCL